MELLDQTMRPKHVASETAHRTTELALGLEDEQNHCPSESVLFPTSCAPVTFVGTQVFIKTLTIQQMQQEGPTTLGACPLSTVHTTRPGMSVKI